MSGCTWLSILVQILNTQSAAKEHEILDMKALREKEAQLLVRMVPLQQATWRDVIFY